MNIDEYVLITPARNEEEYIERTLKAVISQSVLPKKWVVVSDNSTDHTDDIVTKYSEAYKFIQLIRKVGGTDRNFGSKINAFNAGYDCVRNEKYEFIGNLDADVSFEQNYFQKIIWKFKKNSKIGIAGGIIQELIKGEFVIQNVSLDSVAGAVQMFRRDCYENIGGYTAIYGGGVDAVAEIKARMHGWEVQTFPDVKVLHHRRVASGMGNIIRARFRQGIMYNLIGYHPIFLLARCFYKINDKPYLVGSILRLYGYLWSNIRGHKRPVDKKFVKYIRSEQMSKLISIFRKQNIKTRYDKK